MVGQWGALDPMEKEDNMAQQWRERLAVQTSDSMKGIGLEARATVQRQESEAPQHAMHIEHADLHAAPAYQKGQCGGHKQGAWKRSLFP